MKHMALLGVLAGISLCGTSIPSTSQFLVEIVRPSYILEKIKEESSQGLAYPETALSACAGLATGGLLWICISPSERLSHDKLYHLKSALALTVATAGGTLIGSWLYQTSKRVAHRTFRNNVVRVLFKIKQDVLLESYRQAIHNLVQVYGGHVDMLAYMLDVGVDRAEIVLQVWRQELENL